MKIAIFSGAIPSTTFIENLVKGVAVYEEVMLFGVMKSPKAYKEKNIIIYKTPSSHWSNLCFTLYRSCLLILKQPKDFYKLLKEIKRFNRIYDKWIWFSKFLPIVLYRPDILHLQWARDVEFYSFLKEKFDIKLVVSLRGAHINYTPIVEPKVAKIYRDIFPKVDAFHAVSEAISIETQKYGAELAKIKLIHSPIQSRFFDFFTPYNKSEHKVIKIVSVGRFHWIKGFKNAFDAMYLLKEAGYEINYTIIGVKNLTENLLFQRHQLQLESQINLIDTLTQDDLIKTMKTFDIMLLPSLKEGIANVVLEAMAIGLPVVSTDCEGMNEVIKHKETGWLVPVRNPNAIANAIIEIFEASETDLQRITTKAHKFVKKHFNAKDSIQKFLDLYQSLTK